jgi:hypothetical protein
VGEGIKERKKKKEEKGVVRKRKLTTWMKQNLI